MANKCLKSLFILKGLIQIRVFVVWSEEENEKVVVREGITGARKWAVTGGEDVSSTEFGFLVSEAMPIARETESNSKKEREGNFLVSLC